MQQTLRFVAAVALAAITLPAAAATIVVDAGTRIQTMSFTNGIFGQSFVSPGTELVSVGLQFATLNPTGVQNSVTVAIREGAGLDGAVLGTTTFSPVNVGRNDPKVFTTIDFAGIGLTLGADYTITVVNNGGGSRNGIVFGPNLIDPPFGREFGPDAYPDGGLLFTGNAFSPCTTLQRCDLNFTVETVAANAVPEPATWALMIAGFGLVGLSLRRRIAVAG